MIYIDDNIDGFDLDESLMAVSPQRREYALRYRQERDRRLCIAAYRLLWKALHVEYGIDEAPVFIYDGSGKPMLQGHPGIHFSLSHCQGVAACALSDHPIGIDVETLDHYSEDVARQVMNDDEMRQILDSPNPALAFTRLWTMKESLFKLTGGAHGSNPANLLDDVGSYRFTTVIHPHYIYTACTKPAQ